MKGSQEVARMQGADALRCEIGPASKLPCLAGVEEALQSMQLGELWALIIPPRSTGSEENVRHASASLDLVVQTLSEAVHPASALKRKDKCRRNPDRKLEKDREVKRGST